MATRVDWSSLSLRKNPLSDDFVGSSPTSRTQLALWYNGYLMYLIYVHNYSVQSVDSSERMIVMLCAYLNSFPYRIFIFLLFICLIRV